MVSVKWASYNEAKELAGFLELLPESPPSGAYCAIAYKDGELAGAGYVYFAGKKARKYAAVKEGFRRQGIGGLLFRMLIRRAFDMGYAISEIKSPAEAEGFFLSLGYVRAGEEDGHFLMEREGDVSGKCGS